MSSGDDVCVITALVCSESIDEFRVIIDSGCSAHMFNTYEYLSELVIFESPTQFVHVANGGKLPVVGKGLCGVLGEVFYVPALSHNLLSPRMLDERGFSTVFVKGMCSIINRVTQAELVGVTYDTSMNLYVVGQHDFERMLGVQHVACLAHTMKRDLLSKIHYTFNHISADRVRYLCKCQKFPGLVGVPSVRLCEVVKDCDFCRRTKVHHPVTNQSVPRRDVLGELWFVDVKGRISTPSLKFKNHYVFGIIESKSRYLIQYFVRNKSDVFECIREFVKVYVLPQRKLDSRLQKVFIHSDMGEFDSQKIRDYLYEHAIYTTTSCAYMSEHNGVIERVWRTITDAAICNLLVAELDESYWEEARRCAAYVYNRIPGAHYGVHSKSPFEVFWGFAPRIRHFKIFGSVAYVMIPIKKKDHSAKAQRGVFVGYQDRQPVGYRVYIPESNEFVISYRVTFVESPNGSPEEAVYYDDDKVTVWTAQHNDVPGRSGSGTTGSDASRKDILVTDHVIDGLSHGVGSDQSVVHVSGSSLDDVITRVSSEPPIDSYECCNQGDNLGESTMDIVAECTRESGRVDAVCTSESGRVDAVCTSESGRDDAGCTRACKMSVVNERSEILPEVIPGGQLDAESIVDTTKWGAAAACSVVIDSGPCMDTSSSVLCEMESHVEPVPDLAVNVLETDRSMDSEQRSNKRQRVAGMVEQDSLGECQDSRLVPYWWLVGTRHLDDEDHRMYQVKQVYFSHGSQVPAVRRVRVTRFGVLEDAGQRGHIQAEYAVRLTRETDSQGWCSNYKRISFALGSDEGSVGIVSVEGLRRSDVRYTPEVSIGSEVPQRKLLDMLVVSAGYGDIVSMFALQAGIVKVDVKVPTSHKMVLKSKQKIHWMAAEAAEMESFRENQVLEPSWLPTHKKALRTKWIYTLKYDTQGNIKKYKARLVARGYEQEYGIDFEETFSPVTRLQSLRLLFALSAQLGLVTHQMDVKTAFLNAELDEETYIEIPEGVTPDVECDCFRLKRALYGLKQSPRLWNININAFLLSLGFSALPNEPCLYMRRDGSKLALIALYVDDMVIAGSDMDIVQDIKNKLSERYQMADLGEVNQILGCEVKREGCTGRVTMCQRLYIRMIIKKFFPDLKLNPVRTPMASRTPLSKAQGPVTPEDIEFMSLIPYRQAVGCLLWLAMGTRPDIAFAVAQVARYCENPGRVHWEAVCRIFRYLAGTLNMGLVYSVSDVPLHGHSGCDLKDTLGVDLHVGEVSESLRVFSDSDHARCPDTRRSITGFVFYLAGSPICWQSRQQPTVALSSMEAEYMAACATTQEALWLIAILKGLGFQQSRPVQIHEDNQSAIAYSKNPTQHKYTKHIATRYHFVREQVDLKTVELIKVDTRDNVADLFTKPLEFEDHWRHTTRLLVSIPDVLVHDGVL